MFQNLFTRLTNSITSCIQVKKVEKPHRKITEKQTVSYIQHSICTVTCWL